MHWQTHGMWNSHLITSSMSQDLLSLIGTYLQVYIFHGTLESSESNL